VGDELTANNGNGITWTNAFNTIGQLSQISTNWLSPTQTGTVASGITYNALAEPTSDSLGNGLQESWSWLPMRVSGYSAGSAYNFGSTVGVGPLIQGANDSVNGNWTYTYDNFQRLSASACSGNCPLGQSSVSFNYLYDPVGNRWQQNLTAGSGDAPQYSFGSWNHISGSGIAYDSPGNITSDGPPPGGHTYVYDAEDRLIKVDSGSTATYKYNAMGRRVTEATSAGSFEYLMDLQGNPVTKLIAGTSTTSSSEVFIAGRHWGTDVMSSSLLFMHSDWLGTGRAWTNLSGTVVQDCQGFPFGDSLYCQGSANGTDDNFAGLTYDPEDAMYHASFREVSPIQGRWMRPDPAGLAAVDLTNPQSWNRYAYVTNNPVSHIDPTGLVTINPSWYMGFSNGWAWEMVGALLQGGGAVQCPNNNCGIGTSTPYQCVGSACGYMSNQYVGSHENEVNGVLFTNAQYAQYLQGIMEGQRGAIVDQLTQTLCAPGDASCAATVNSEVTLNTSVGKNGRAGGNYNFSLGVDIQSELDLSGCFDLRCGGFDSLHFAYPGTVHLDTANPFSYWGLGAIVHGFVDFLLGNTIMASGIPR
jgi:RHS repeat-associated protein